MQSITSFALYGFPESHAASFALLAYASAYLKCHYLAAFTCAHAEQSADGLLSPAMLVKDAQRHGLRVLPVDVNVSEWNCTVEGDAAGLAPGAALRSRAAGRSRQGDRGRRGRYEDVDDLARRVPGLRKDEMEMLAERWRARKLGNATGATRCGKRGGRGVPSDHCWRCPETLPEAPLERMTTQ